MFAGTVSYLFIGKKPALPAGKDSLAPTEIVEGRILLLSQLALLGLFPFSGLEVRIEISQLVS